MTNEEFLQQFDCFVNAPNGIQKLRELVLQLAVTGRLVSASVFLEEIRSEKARKISDGNFKKPKALPSILEDVGIHEIPYGWSYSRLGELVRVINGRAYKRHEMLQSGTPLLRVGTFSLLMNGTTQISNWRMISIAILMI